MRRLIILLFVIIPFISFAQKQKPKLVVGIVVDQMRYDFLTRFWDRYGNDGFKKLVTEGYNCKNTNFNYMPTYTGPGHASIYTGTTPENHGIISNHWYNKVTKNSIYCTEDSSVRPLGGSHVHGQMSPTNMLGSTITDELKLATNKRGKVIGISIKDRGAILPAGHMADAAYWFEGEETGSWISSTFYMEELPSWLKKINENKPADKHLNKPWNTLYPIETYKESLKDDNAYEELFIGETAPVFPHNLPALRGSNSNYSLIKSTPFGNTIVKDLALETIKNEELGEDKYTDFLTVSFSSPDYIGHRYGPMSVEIEDTYLRLDKDIAQIIDYLEKKFTKENILIFLTADHGAVNVPQYLIDNSVPAGYFDLASLRDVLRKHLINEYNTDSLIANISNYQVFLNKKKIAESNLKLEAVENSISPFLLTQKGIAQVVTGTSLRTTEFKDRFLGNTQRGYNQVRSGDVLFVLESGWIPSTSRTGTTHGSPYHYDTHVPLLWYGAGINKGETNAEIIIPDIAATIAALLEIQPPSACTGKPILELMK
jgi:predicted AlkP superfamily pyrophosphatase or phosphodiesterase